MATKRQRKRKQARINTADLSPRVAAGLAQGQEEIEAMEQAYAEGPKMPSGVEMLRQWEAEQGSTGRVPTPKFVGQNLSTGFVRQRQDGTRLADTRLNFPPEVTRAMQEGMICLRCLEPQSHAFADQHIEGCEGVLLHGERYMRDRQIIDFAMEFEGTTHLGPSKPMSELLDAQSERLEKRAFIKKVLDGGQGHIPAEWVQDEELMAAFSPADRLALVRSAR